MVNQPARSIYKFDDFYVDAQERVLLRGGKMIPLPPKVFDTLLVLVENRGRIMEKDALMRLLWPDSFVEESSLSQNIFQLRKALGEEAAQPRYIETIPKRGYRFIASVVSAPPLSAYDEADFPESINYYPGEEVDGLDVTGAAEFAPARRAAALHSAEEPPAGRARTRRGWLVAALGLTVAVGLGLSAVWLSRVLSRPKSLNQKMRITRLTAVGKAFLPSLSPDGKYVAYVTEEGGKQSVWVRQVATPSNVQVVPPTEVDYQGLTFSRDGNYLYYVTYARPKRLGVLYRVPVLGGTAQKLVEDVDSTVTFAPDGEQMAFVRNYPGQDDSALMTANVDGSSVRKLVSRKRPDFFSVEGPAWSPDGKLIACGTGGVAASGLFMSIALIRVADGVALPLSAQNWASIGQIGWLKDNSGLIVSAWHKSSPVVSDQIWRITYPGGETSRITNDLGNYTYVGLADNLGLMVTTQMSKISQLWIVPQGDAARATPIPTVRTDNYGEWLGLSWTPGGQLVFGSRAAGNADLWMIEADGSNLKQLTVEPGLESLPAVAPDGSFIAFVSNRTGTQNIWRMDEHGGNQQRLTSGEGETFPSVSPDGKWVYYSTMGKEKIAIWKVPASGGNPTQLTKNPSFRPVVSPDGKLLAHYQLAAPEGELKLAVTPADGGEPIKLFPAPNPDMPLISWLPDSQTISYIKTVNGVSNLWGQPIDGGPPKPLTDFRTDLIYRFAWSKDGQKLACERGYYLSDIVLISDFL